MESMDEIDYEALPDNSPLAAQLAAGALAGIMEHTVMFPLDSLKTRMQTNQVSASEGLMSAAAKITAKEGPLALWRGVSSVVLGAGPAHALYYLVFEATKSRLCGTTSVVTEKRPIIASVAGVCATVTSDLVMTPFDVVKQRAQMHNSQSLVQTTWSIYKKEGMAAFFLSYPTTLILSIPFAALNFGVYESVSDILNPSQHYNPLVHCFAGGLAGGVAAGLTTPLDMVKTLLQTQISNVKTFQGALKVVWKENGLWKGIKPRVLFNVPSAAISWTAYEMAKKCLL